jgi:hypothetical protein
LNPDAASAVVLGKDAHMLVGEIRHRQVVEPRCADVAGERAGRVHEDCCLDAVEW